MKYLLTISTDAGKPNAIRQTGIAHSLGVCLIEDFNMARGKVKDAEVRGGGAMPRFVDVKLSAEDRKEFQTWPERSGDLVRLLQALADDGYRVGVSWSGEQQAYTVSLTGRGDESPNKGLCMTSFARDLSTALWLALYKHVVITKGSWLDNTFGGGGEFG